MSQVAFRHSHSQAQTFQIIQLRLINKTIPFNIRISHRTPRDLDRHRMMHIDNSPMASTDQQLSIGIVLAAYYGKSV